jgi:hypothetical protein
MFPAPHIRLNLASRPAAPQRGPVIQAVRDAIGIIEVVPHIQAADNRCRFQTERLRLKQVVILVRTVATHGEVVHVFAR